jgi:metallo-beta-lactamase family protein
MVVESTYGDKVHETREDSDLRFERVIEDTINRGGVLMIPAFSLERSQMIIFRVHELMDKGRIPKVPVFLDSPLSIKATKIYSQYLKERGDIFNFPNLKKILTSEESKEINAVSGSKIIIAGSGMCNGGRILRHLIQYLPETKNTLLFISYQVAGSLGRKLSEGEKIVNILGEEVIVAARVENIEGYSSHPDGEKLYDFVKNSADSLKKIFVVHGELKSNLFFTQRLRDHLGLDAISPKYGQFFEIDI